jgi:hypothetical protein
VKKNKNIDKIAATAKAGSEIRYRLMPLAFMAVISLNLERELYVSREAKRMAAGRTSEIMSGIEYKK